MPRGTSQSDEAILQNRVWQLSSLAPALAIWLDSADASTITLNGSGVSQWRDKSGNGVNVGLWADRPSYNSAGLNGKPALSFDGNDGLANTGFTFDHTAGSIFVVGNMGDVNSYEMFATLGSGNNDTLYMRRSKIADSISFGAGSAIVSAPYTNNTNAIFSAQYTANGTATVFVNGVQEPSSNLVGNLPGVTTTSNLYIGGPSNFFVGSISEIIILSSSINSANRQKVEGYLAWKWGLRNLPTRHPFLNRIPVIGD